MQFVAFLLFTRWRLIKRITAQRHDSCLPLRQVISSILSSFSCIIYCKDIISCLILISRWELRPVTENKMQTWPVLLHPKCLFLWYYMEYLNLFLQIVNQIIHFEYFYLSLKLNFLKFDCFCYFIALRQIYIIWKIFRKKTVQNGKFLLIFWTHYQIRQC